MSSSQIKQVNSCPDYIHLFIQHNLTKLTEIYDEGMSQFQEGCLGLICDETINKMDVLFMNTETICKQMTLDSWESLRQSIPKDKRLFLVKDEKLNSIFLLYL